MASDCEHQGVSDSGQNRLLNVEVRRVLTLALLEGGGKGVVWRPGPTAAGLGRGGGRRGRQRRRRGTAWH